MISPEFAARVFNEIAVARARAYETLAAEQEAAAQEAARRQKPPGKPRRKVERAPRTDRSVWPRYRIIAAMWLWAAQHDGRAPTPGEWKLRVDGWPTCNDAVREWGSWSAGLAAAGFEKVEDWAHKRARERERDSGLPVTLR